MGKRHGMSKTPTYRSWEQMLNRCRNRNAPDWETYGGAGIGVCGRWESFPLFLQDMGVRPDGTSIDRINGSLGYSPENCRWATATDQSRNRRVFRNNKTGARGVFKLRNSGRYQAYITVNRTQISLGTFDLFEEAKQARAAGELEYWN